MKRGTGQISRFAYLPICRFAVCLVRRKRETGDGSIFANRGPELWVPETGDRSNIVDRDLKRLRDDSGDADRLNSSLAIFLPERFVAGTVPTKHWRLTAFPAALRRCTQTVAANPGIDI